MALTYTFSIDWNNDGSFTGTGDDVTLRIKPGVSITYGREQARALSPIATGSAGFELKNDSRDYYPDNASSPIYPNVLPGRPVRILGVLSGTTYVLFRGHLDDFNLIPDRNVKKVSASALDALAKLKEATATTDLYPSIRTGAAIGAILDAIGWPAAGRHLDVGASTLRWWVVDGADAWNAIQDIVSAEGSPALITVDSDGSIVYRDRHHRLRSTLNSNTSFEMGTSGWSGNGGTFTQSSTYAHSGTYSGKLVPNGVSSNVYIEGDQYPVVVGNTYTAEAWMRCDVARTLNLNVNWFDVSHNYLSTSTSSIAVSANTWTFLRSYHVAPASTVYATINPTMSSTPPASHILYADEVTLTGPSASIATFRDTGTEPLFSAPMVYDQGWRDVVNDVSFTVEERAPAPDLSVIWSSDQSFSIASGNTLTIIASGNDPFYGLISPVNGVDYQVRAGSAAVSLSRTQGRSTTISITATGNTVVDSLQVRGYAVPVGRTVQVTASDSASITAYGRKAGPADAGPACVEDAQAIANLVVASRATRLPIVQIKLIGANDTRLTQCLARDLSDRVTIVDAETGLNRQFFIEAISHDLPQAGLLHSTTFGCEAVPTGSGLDSPTGVFIFDHPTQGKFGTGQFAT